MQISVVIPTRNRKGRLFSLLSNLAESSYRVHEVIIVDASDEPLQNSELAFTEKLNVRYLRATSSVCIQRNIGIEAATCPWIFLCDDDVEVPADYLRILAMHVATHADAGAVSGIFLQKENDVWAGQYPVRSGKELLLKYFFGLSVWGGIEQVKDSFLTRSIKAFYLRKGNHISKAGWPVITNFSAPYATVPTYTLGASLVRRDWLQASPFEEVLDRHGIGDNYGVAISFPSPLHLVSEAFVYHNQAPENRLLRPLQYYRRALALDYFIRTKPALQKVNRGWFLWSLLGNALIFLAKRDRLMLRPALQTFSRIIVRANPYLVAAGRGEKVVEATLQ